MFLKKEEKDSRKECYIINKMCKQKYMFLKKEKKTTD